MDFIEPIVTREEMDSVPGPMPSYADVDKMYNFFATSNLADSLRITLKSVMIHGVKVTDYSSLIVARFYIDGDLYVRDAAGYAVNISEMISDIRGLL